MNDFKQLGKAIVQNQSATQSRLEVQEKGLATLDKASETAIKDLYRKQKSALDEVRRASTDAADAANGTKRQLTKAVGHASKTAQVAVDKELAAKLEKLEQLVIARMSSFENQLSQHSSRSWLESLAEQVDALSSQLRAKGSSPTSDMHTQQLHSAVNAVRQQVGSQDDQLSMLDDRFTRLETDESAEAHHATVEAMQSRLDESEETIRSLRSAAETGSGVAEAMQSRLHESEDNIRALRSAAETGSGVAAAQSDILKRLTRLEETSDVLDGGKHQTSTRNSDSVQLALHQMEGTVAKLSENQDGILKVMDQRFDQLSILDTAVRVLKERAQVHEEVLMGKMSSLQEVHSFFLMPSATSAEPFRHAPK